MMENGGFVYDNPYNYKRSILTSTSRSSLVSTPGVQSEEVLNLSTEGEIDLSPRERLDLSTGGYNQGGGRSINKGGYNRRDYH